MIERNITLPEMILWTGTRIALGIGIIGKKNVTRPEIRSVA